MPTTIAETGLAIKFEIPVDSDVSNLVQGHGFNKTKQTNQTFR